jgi:hypothetical protein
MHRRTAAYHYEAEVAKVSVSSLQKVTLESAIHERIAAMSGTIS